nr:tetratricopeptide repeat protein [Methanosarcina horonobensis]
MPYYTGLSCFETGNYAEAVKAFDRFLETEVQNPEILQKRALALFELGRSEEAVSAVNSLLELSAENLTEEDKGDKIEKNSGRKFPDLSGTP